MSILVTRPAASGHILCQKLTALGYDVMHEPMLAIKPVVSVPPDFTSFAALLITSANALAMLPDVARREAQQLPCLCVGDATAAAARAAGFTEVHSAKGAGADLAQLVQRHFPQSHAHFLHICGAETDSTVQTLLHAAHYQVTSWVVYQAIPQTAFSPTLSEALAQNFIKVVLLFSPRSAHIFVTLAHQAKLDLRTLWAISLSPAVAAALDSWPGQSAIADMPTEDALIACLQRHYPALSAHD